MRFLAGGPLIPDELLNARDEGQVIFFCGAGVSLAKAGLPSFLSLADRVLDGLGAHSESPARKFFAASINQAPIAGVGGLFPSDRIFGLLEREFTIDDIRREVANALRPKRRVDLSAHRTLLDLARGPDGRTRLVTTNFDLLFEGCDRKLRSVGPPSLPDPSRASAFDGIIHLHGLVNRKYDAAIGDEFVLSSADFGRAYLADGWATSFIRTLLKEYQIVFLGYSADDPPVHYLLEALNSNAGSHSSIYAFQAGVDEDAKALWRYKGVQAIAYNPADGHSALWATLEAWAERARDPSIWAQSVVSKSLSGPRKLADFERGQVKHLVSTVAGARRFGAAAPTAEWLCVFDRTIRYATPSRSDDGEVIVDPFDLYGLDDEAAPTPPQPDNPFARRDIPSEAWDAFELSAEERTALDPQFAPSLRGVWANSSPTLPMRLAVLGEWLVSVAHEPISAWWGAGQADIHEAIKYRVSSRTQEGPPTIVAKAWEYIFRAWEGRGSNRDLRYYDLGRRARIAGWSPALVRQWMDICRPRLTAQRPRSNEWPPTAGIQDLAKILSIDVEYYSEDDPLHPPEELLPLLVAERRRGLEIAVELEVETAGYEGLVLPPLERLVEEDEDDRRHGIAKPFFAFADALQELHRSDPSAWRAEVRGWLGRGRLFSRLRVWASGRPTGLPAKEAADILLAISDEVFWSSEAQRDLLTALSQRWGEYPVAMRGRLERRLLRGPPRRTSETNDQDFRRRRAHSILSRISWLRSTGCELPTATNEVLNELKAAVPQWRDDFADNAVRSAAMRVGWVRQDESTQGLELVPVSEILAQAVDRSRRDFDTFVEKRPLRGLARHFPTKLLKALVIEAARGSYSKVGWEELLNADQERIGKGRMARQIASRLLTLPDEFLLSFLYGTTEWILRKSEILQKEYTKEYDLLFDKCIDLLRRYPSATHPPTVRTQGIDWAGHSLNAPAGKLAQAMFKDSRRKAKGRTLRRSWADRATRLLELPGDARRDVIVMFSNQLNWIYYKNAIWAEDNILCVLASDKDEDQRAFWDGFFWAARVPHADLFSRLKKNLLNLVDEADDHLQGTEHLAGILLSGWNSRMASSGDRFISDAEMRDAIISGTASFRSHIVWHLGRWANSRDRRWSSSAIEFLQRIWPRQKSIRTPDLSEKLFDMAVEWSGDFGEIVRAVDPLLVPMSSNSYAFHQLSEKLKVQLTQSDLKSVLRLVYAVLGKDPQQWPYLSREIVQKLAEHPSLASDERMVQLRVLAAAG